MPNIYGLYNRLEMRDYVRRCMDGLRATVSPVDQPGLLPGTVDLAGTETNPIIDPLFSNNDINLQLNAGLVAIHQQLVVANPDAMADEEYVNIEALRVEYPLPPDLMQLRELGWKAASTTYTFAPQTEYIYMHKVDEPSGLWGAGYNGAPTYRMALGRFFINESWAVKVDNHKGVKVRYVKWPAHWDLDEAYLETQFARGIQEVLARQAAIALIELRTKLDASPLKAERDSILGDLIVTVRNSLDPTTINFVGRHPLTNRTGMPR